MYFKSFLISIYFNLFVNFLHFLLVIRRRDYLIFRVMFNAATFYIVVDSKVYTGFLLSRRLSLNRLNFFM